MKLTRSREDVVFSGLLSGIGEYYNIDPTIVRIIVVVLFFTITPLPVVPLYIVGVILVPKAPKNSDSRNEQQARRQRMDRAFEKSNHEKRESSSQTKPVDEEDWSDF